MENELVRLQKKRIIFNIARETKELNDLIKDLPNDDEVLKIVLNGRRNDPKRIKNG